MGHRHVRASREESTRRDRDALPARGDDAAAKGRVMRRSLHFVPGGNERMMQKALTLHADGLILDLEDAVTPEKKPATRPIVRRWLETLDFGAQERWVRMNQICSDYAIADLTGNNGGRRHGHTISQPGSRVLRHAREETGHASHRPALARDARFRRAGTLGEDESDLERLRDR